MKHTLHIMTRENQLYHDLLLERNLPELVILADEPLSASKADIWLAEPKLAAQSLPQATQLTWMQSTFAGVDNLMAGVENTPTLRTDYLLTNVRGIFGPLMSEYVFGYLLAYHRQHQLYKQNQTNNLWQAGAYRSLKNQHLLLLGTGSIAQHIAKTAKHFGMRVTGLNRTAVSKSGSNLSDLKSDSLNQDSVNPNNVALSDFDCVDNIANLSVHLPLADTIVSILPNTPATFRLLNADTLALLKPNAVLFNLGRGNVLDLDALLTQLLNNPLQLAIVDVFEQEPLSNSHPIWQCPNAIITPHVAAPSFPEQIIDIFVENLQRFKNNQPLKYQVDFKKGY